MKLSYEKEYRHCLENSNKRELVDKIIYDTKIFIKKDKDIKELHNKIDKIKKYMYENSIDILYKENDELKCYWNMVKADEIEIILKGDVDE